MPSIECNGAEIYYEDRGEGRPVVFLHGVMAGMRYLRPQMDDLSMDHRVVAFDFRGHGRSEKTEAGHSLPQYAKDLHCLMNRLDLRGVVLVGWSMGALVAWEYIARFGTGMLSGVVDVDMEPTRYRWNDYEYGTSDLDGLVKAIRAIQEDHISFIEGITEPLMKHPPSSEIRTMMLDETSRCPPSIKAAILFDTTFRDYRKVIPGIDVPMLVMAGADEKWRPVANVKYVSELLPDARFELFEESGHVLSLEEPGKFNRVLRDFISNDVEGHQ